MQLSVVWCGVRRHPPVGPASKAGACFGLAAPYYAPMKFFVALIVWFIIAAVMATGIVLAVTGKSLLFRGDLLIASLLVYIGMFSKYGCLTH